MIRKIISLLLFLSFISGCASVARKPFNLQNNIAKITYDSRECREMLDKRILCNHVIFTRKTVSIEDLREDK